MAECDWNNREVPENEDPDSIIKVWEIHTPNGEYDRLVVRGWADMLTLVQDHIESELENMTDEDELKNEGVSVTVKLKEMTKRRYDEIQEC